MLILQSAIALACSLSPLSACRETGDVQVTSIEFMRYEGAQPDELKAIIATRENGFLPWSRKHFFDRSEFDRDVKRSRRTTPTAAIRRRRSSASTCS